MISLFAGKLTRFLIPEERLPIATERASAILISVDATLDLMGGISWKNRQFSRIPSGVTQSLIGHLNYQLIIGECELASAVIAILLLGMRHGLPRIIILCACNMNWPQRFESSKSHGLATCALLRKLLLLRIDNGVEVIPMYVRSARNISADNLTRWVQYECERRMYADGLQMVALPELWEKWECEREQRMIRSALNSFEISAPLYQFYLTHRVKVVEWRSEMYSITRILGGIILRRNTW